MVFKHFGNHSAGFIDVAVIRDAKRHFDTADWMVTMIDNLLAPNATIRNDDLLVVEGAEDRCEQRDLFDIAELPCGVDEITNFVRAENHQHDTSGQVGHRAL